LPGIITITTKTYSKAAACLTGIAAAFHFGRKQNMKSAEEYLEAQYRDSITPAMLKSSTLLPLEVSFAADLGLKLAPIPSHSRFVSPARVRAGNPTSDPDQLSQFASEFPNCNWALETSNVAVLEYNPAIGRQSLRDLCGGDWDGWCHTLQFRAGEMRFLLFRHHGERLRVLGSRSLGLRVHAGQNNMILVPPSRFLTGPRLVWTDPSAAIESIPAWLLEAGDASFGGNPPPTIPTILPFA
jgi:hypothetical protein